jgi:hypothetical protein
LDGFAGGSRNNTNQQEMLTNIGVIISAISILITFIGALFMAALRYRQDKNYLWLPLASIFLPIAGILAVTFLGIIVSTFEFNIGL